MKAKEPERDAKRVKRNCFEFAENEVCIVFKVRGMHLDNCTKNDSRKGQLNGSGRDTTED